MSQNPVWHPYCASWSNVSFLVKFWTPCKLRKKLCASIPATISASLSTPESNCAVTFGVIRRASTNWQSSRLTSNYYETIKCVKVSIAGLPISVVSRRTKFPHQNYSSFHWSLPCVKSIGKIIITRNQSLSRWNLVDNTSNCCPSANTWNLDNTVVPPPGA